MAIKKLGRQETSMGKQQKQLEILVCLCFDTFLGTASYCFSFHF